MNTELFQLKIRLIDTMIRVRGESYTLGWLRGAYLIGCDDVDELEILQKTLTELESVCASRVDNIRVGL